MGSTAKKPLSVKIIGGIFIGISVLMGLAVIRELVASGSYQAVSGVDLPTFVPGAFRTILDYYQDHYVLFTVGQVLLSAVMLVAGTQLLRLRSWARATLEVIAWLGMLYIALVEIFYLGSWVGFMTGPAVEGLSRFAATVIIIGIMFGVSLWALILYTILKFLRSEELRKVFKDHADKELLAGLRPQSVK